MDCDKQFDRPRAVPDPRMKIMLSDDGKLSWRIQDMNPATARECAARIVFCIRMRDMYSPELDTYRFGAMIDLAFTPFGDQKSICVAHNLETGAIQASINGVSGFEASIMCESFVHYANAMIGDAFTIDETDSS